MGSEARAAQSLGPRGRFVVSASYLLGTLMLSVLCSHELLASAVEGTLGFSGGEGKRTQKIISTSFLLKAD